MKRFELIDHTADVGLAVSGADLCSLFENAAEGLFSIITDLSRVEPRIEKWISLREDSLERLLVSWLSELLYLHEVEHLLFSRFRVESVGDGGLEAISRGEVFRDGCHVIKTEIKAVTYHQIEIKKEGGMWKARVFLDL